MKVESLGNTAREMAGPNRCKSHSRKLQLCGDDWETTVIRIKVVVGTYGIAQKLIKLQALRDRSKVVFY